MTSWWQTGGIRAKAGTIAVVWLAALWIGTTLPNAQGAFYQEEVKDGRIYVFNIMSVYEEWKRTGEIAKSITRVGEGPNGETLVFDSEEAIHLYNFRHGRPGEVIIKPPEPKPKANWSWKDGKTTFESDRASLIISNRIQFRYTHEQPDGGQSKGSFRIRRAKTKFEGWIYTKDLTYELQMNWADTVDFAGSNQRILEDAALSYDVTRGRKAVMFKGGQFKVPFGRQELTSSGSQQFVDRSIVSTLFAGNSRDQGLQMWGQTPRGTIEWRAMISNGNGINRSANDNDKFRTNGRVVWQPLGDVRYSESDFESTTRPLLAIAVAYDANNFQVPDPNGMRPDVEIYSGDVHFKFKGFSVLADYFRRLSDPETVVGGVPVDVSETRGYNAQAGLFVYKRFVEIAARYAVIDLNATEGADGDRQFERGVALNWFLNKHNLKLQTDYRQLETELTDLTADEYRLQAQWIF